MQTIDTFYKDKRLLLEIEDECQRNRKRKNNFP